jgi:L-lactate dehydrogenase
MKVGIVGSGLVGSTAAYAMVLQGVGREIVLVDRNGARAEAEANDIFHAVPFSNPLTIVSGDYADLSGSGAVILAAGVSQKPGESRLELLGRNAAVFRDVVPQVLKHAPNAVLVVATNPVDVMTHLAARFAAEFSVPSTRIIGSGTTLDTARFRTLLGTYFGVDAKHVHGYVVGEHGDSEVLTWSAATIAGLTLEEFGERRGIAFDDQSRQQIDGRVRRAAYEIIAGKGATYFGIGCALAQIVKAIINDQRAILTVSTQSHKTTGLGEVTLALPHLLGGAGIISALPLNLNADEQASLHNSAGVIRDAIDSLAS